MADATEEQTPHPDPERLKRSHGTEAPAQERRERSADLRRLPLVPLRDDVVFPKLIVPLSVGRRTSIAAITAAMDRDKQVLLVAQKDPQIDDTVEKDLYSIGAIAEINGMRQTPAGVQMLVAGVQRARIVGFTQFKPFIEVEIEVMGDQVGDGEVGPDQVGHHVLAGRRPPPDHMAHEHQRQRHTEGRPGHPGRSQAAPGARTAPGGAVGGGEIGLRLGGDRAGSEHPRMLCPERGQPIRPGGRGGGARNRR